MVDGDITSNANGVFAAENADVRVNGNIVSAEADGVHYKDADFNGACAIILGSEGAGVSHLVREKCDFTVSIPMRGHVNSLNVSTAASVLLFEAAEKQGRN